MEIRNLNDLRDVILPYIESALISVEAEVDVTIYSCIIGGVNGEVGYYTEPVFNNIDPTYPAQYNRTYALRDGYKASDIIRIPNGYTFTCGWEDSYLQFTYKGGASGLQVLEWFDDSSHGGKVKGSHRFWTEALEKLGGEEGITDMFISQLKKRGVPIKK